MKTTKESSCLFRKCLFRLPHIREAMSSRCAAGRRDPSEIASTSPSSLVRKLRTARGRRCRSKPQHGSQPRLRDLAAHPREVCQKFPYPLSQRAQGMPGARCARSLVCDKKQAYEHSHHGHTGITRHSPRSGFNGLFRALPGDRACLPPSPAERPASLTPASGCQDHTPLPSASHAVRYRRIRVHRIPPRGRDDRVSPLQRERDGGRYRPDLGFGKTEIFLQRGLDRQFSDLPVGQIS